MKKTIDLSIITVSYNTKELLDCCLASIYDSLRSSKLAFETIVVDNASTDGSGELVGKKYPQAILIKNRLNLGFGKANNQAVAKAQGKTLLFLNSDTEVLNRAIETLYRFYQSLPASGITGGKLLNPDLTAQPSCGPEYNLGNIILALFFKGDYLHITRYSPDCIKKVDWVMGACMMVKQEIFKQVGGFDEGIFMYMEEIDFQYRAKKQGINIFFYPQARFIHQGAGSSRGRETPILNVFRGLIFFYKKNHSQWKLILLRVILVCKSLIAMFLFRILNKKNDQILYNKALKLALS